ncbi:MAG: hypothetical protein H8D56_02045 [Planctomycetes bacterium]|nr:hypothetical protein [Planctomycetota bacterium]MBL7146387.1 hypothetical protein [Phycisphaerae bacterium]
MEPEMNESFGQPYGSQSQPEQKSTGQQNSLQQTFLNLKPSTWIKCVVISIILSVVAVFIAPEFSTAQSGQPGQTIQPSQQQEVFNSYCEYEEDMYDYSQYEDGWNDDYYDCQEDSSYDYYDQSENSWSDDDDDYGYESEYDCEDNWYDDFETEEDNRSYEAEDNWSDNYETEDDWSYDYESEDDWSDDYEDNYEYQENTYEYDYYYDD